MNPQQTIDDVRRYYGEVLSSSSDLKTGACCPAESMPSALRILLEDVHPEVRDRFYGCGSPLPPALEGMTVLDLGCSSGRDAYLLSRLVGPNGRVIGVDMAAEQLAVARRHQDWHAERYGFATSNVTFVEGYIEDLVACGIADASIDVVVSNCVLNLSPEKERVFAEILRVLKPGGELYFSDVFADRRIPEARFETNKPLRVCRNTFDMLAQSRFATHFQLFGGTSTHFGLFDCGPAPATGPVDDCATGYC